jgi:hypothetical protein
VPRKQFPFFQNRKKIVRIITTSIVKVILLHNFKNSAKHSRFKSKALNFSLSNTWIVVSNDFRGVGICHYSESLIPCVAKDLQGAGHTSKNLLLPNVYKTETTELINIECVLYRQQRQNEKLQEMYDVITGHILGSVPDSSTKFSRQYDHYRLFIGRKNYTLIL